MFGAPAAREPSMPARHAAQRMPRFDRTFKRTKFGIGLNDILAYSGIGPPHIVAGELNDKPGQRRR
jgi:hypothetical protein